MKHCKILTIQDYSCYGQCSSAVAIPILNACGHEVSLLPTAVLSTHTGGFSAPCIRDFTGDMSRIIEHWNKEKIQFDYIYIGYLGSIEQIDLIIKKYPDLLKQGGAVILDPVMGDHGRLYKGFNKEYIRKMKELCSIADIILPNGTEAAFLTGSKYTTDYSEEFTRQMCRKLNALGAKQVIITGVSSDEESIGTAIQTNNGVQVYRHRRITGSYYGTGDIFASVFTGATAAGQDMLKAVKTASDFVIASIEATRKDLQHTYGTKFQEALPLLINAIYG